MKRTYHVQEINRFITINLINVNFRVPVYYTLLAKQLVPPEPTRQKNTVVCQISVKIHARFKSC